MKVVAEALCNPIDDEKVLLGLASCLRRAVAAPNPPIDLVIRLGLPEKVMALLDVPSERVLYEAVWIINNIAADKTEFCNVLIKLGCVKPLLKLLESPNSELTELVFNEKAMTLMLEHVCVGKYCRK